MKCPHCGKELDHDYIKYNSIYPLWRSEVTTSYTPLRWLDELVAFKPEGTCINCLRGDCELARKGIPHT